ncbi:uncharacterized protein LOC125198077 [Salvia hispanica]|uniref:uncharacterized protein LOC125198077 n=1 Tax=Salvia hispanica TaxID=49212 RepID=UPI002009CBBD|nr:uncharacterized protein LOC125198077 [Salvia hispanica]
MLKNAGHLCKSHRRGMKGADWAKKHKLYIDEWDMRHERFQSTFDHATAGMEGRINPGYMAWYNRITVSYLTQPGTQSTAGMNESASSMKVLVEMAQGIWHLTSEHDTDPRLRQIREMVAEGLRATGNTDVMEYPTSQRRDVVMPTRPPTSIRHGVPGVRVGGHRYTRQYRLSQPQQPQPEYAEPEPLSPEYDPPSWSVYPGSQSQMSGSSHDYSQWGTRLSCDSFFDAGTDWDAARARRDPYFQNYQFVASVREEEGQQEHGQEEEGEEERRR